MPRASLLYDDSKGELPNPDAELPEE
jgi:hypothetical protein